MDIPTSQESQQSTLQTSDTQQEETSTFPQPPDINWSKITRIIIIIFAFILAGIGGYYLGIRDIHKDVATPIVPSVSQEVATSPTQVVSQQLTYTNKTFGYSLQYPSTWTIDVSAAESSLDKTQPFCYYKNAVTLTAPNNMGKLTISYGPDCLGGQPASLAKTATAMVDGQLAEKVYTSTCQYNYPSPPSDCSSSVSAISYNATGCRIGDNQVTDMKNTFTCNPLQVHGQTMQVTFTLADTKNGLSLTDADFQEIDTQLDAIVASIKVPQPPLHPEIF